MTHGTHPPQADEALRQARESQIINEPATVEACQTDYQAGTAERHASEQRDAKARR